MLTTGLLHRWILVLLFGLSGMLIHERQQAALEHAEQQLRGLRVVNDGLSRRLSSLEFELARHRAEARRLSRLSEPETSRLLSVSSSRLTGGH